MLPAIFTPEHLLTFDSETRSIEAEILTLNIGILGIPGGLCRPFIKALLTIPMIKDCNVDPFIRGEVWSAAPIADADVGADSIHQLTSGTFYKEKLAA